MAKRTQTTETLSTRAQWIKANYSLTQQADGQWVAEVKGCEWSEHRRIVGADRAKVVREFSCRWGHFNYQDEAAAFYEIFR